MAVAEKARTNGVAPRKAGAVPSVPAVLHSAGAARRRRPVRVVVGAAAVVVCAIVGALSVAAVDHRKAVLVVTTTIQPGQVITASNLGYAHVAGQGLATTSDPASVIGKVASGRMPAGSPIVAAELNAASTLASANSVELPMALKNGMFPPDLAVGDQVLLVATSSDGSTTASAPTPVTGQVVSLVADKSFGATQSTTVTVSIARGDLGALADAAAAGQVLVAKAAP